ncbi:MAG: HD domain-containing protein [Proteobacteria bacterium]|nr:HD domain-containing protein [Pseudomonadota bacterium]
MILRDPVHGLLAFEGDAERVVTALLQSREVQRLRHIRQLGLTSLVFPGAEHTRFAHALGAAHVMLRLLARLRALGSQLPAPERPDREAERDALAAALLHDLGHGPFSHLFEDVVPEARSHEAWTHEIISDSGTQVHRALRGLDPGMPERVTGLLGGHHRSGYLARAVSGTLDVDRCDYLLRDSHMTGVRYGLYDLDWLLHGFCFARAGVEGTWVIAIDGRKGLSAIEEFFLARQFMYQQVYHHKSTRAAETLIRAILKRAAGLVRAGECRLQVPPAVKAAALGEKASLGDYLDLDDVQLLACFRSWRRGSDPVLADLTARLAERRLPKTLDLPEDDKLWREALVSARSLAQERGFDPELTVWLHVASDVPYLEPDDRSSAGLWVAQAGGRVQRLGQASFLLGELRNKPIVRPLLIVPAELRSELKLLVESS